MSNKLENIGVYVGCLVFIFMAWQGWRDLHRDISEVKERTSYIEANQLTLERLARIESTHELMREEISKNSELSKK